MMSPDEALKYLEEFYEDIENGWIDVYGCEGGGANEIIVEALKVAVECLKEKRHE